jgi:hypothetical protein
MIAVTRAGGERSFATYQAPLGFSADALYGTC